MALFSAENIHAGDYQYIPGVIAATHHVRKPNGESDTNCDCFVLFDNTIKPEYTQAAIGLITSDDTQTGYFWRKNATDNPAPKINDLIELPAVGNAQPEFHAILKVHEIRLGYYIIATQQVREDVE